MTKETLKGKLGDGDLVIVDVRLGKDWDASEFKIKGAVRGDLQDFDAWGSQYPQDKTLVLYCA
jgi:rhodanese-related sulfurtransferase